jgi:prevent-host-death family protein
MHEPGRPHPIGEATVRELSRDTCSVLRSACEHRRIIITRHGHPVAVLLSIADCIDLVVANEVNLPRPRVERAQMKRQLLARLLGPEIAESVGARQLRRVSRMLSPEP